MKRLFRLKGRDEQFEVELQRTRSGAHGHHSFHRGDRSFEVEIENTGHDRGRLRLHGRTVNFHVLSKDKTVTVWVGGRNYVFEIVDAGGTTDHSTAGALHESLTAPMPGSILKLNVTAGQRFEAHQPLVIMESMKMEMTLSVPHAGIVREVRCSAGQMVDLGAVLLSLDPVEES